MANNRSGAEDARGGDVIVNDSIASGRPTLPNELDPPGDQDVAITADELGSGEQSHQDSHRERNREDVNGNALPDDTTKRDEFDAG